MTTRYDRRNFLKMATAGTGLVLGMSDVPRAVWRSLSRRTPVMDVSCVEGQRRLALLESDAAPFAEAVAQWGRPMAPRFNWVCDYVGQCGWLDSWNPMQVQGYWTNLSTQYAWLTAQHQATIMRQMEYWASLRFQISRPFVMAAMQSVYCSARGSESVVFGLSRIREEVVIRGRTVALANVVLSMMNRQGDADEAQRCGAPQSDSQAGDAVLGDHTEEVREYLTDHGTAAITERQFRDVESNETGRLAIWDSAEGTQRTLVPV